MSARFYAAPRRLPPGPTQGNSGRHSRPYAARPHDLRHISKEGDQEMSQQHNDSSRRDFLKGSAGLIAGAALASTLIPRGAYAASDDTIKIALIGCGGRGSAAASQALSTKGPTKLIAVADAFEDNARIGLRNLKGAAGDKVDVKEDHIFHGFDAYKQAIDAGPDVVVIATPLGFRPIHFEYAVKAGKHIFAEKPVATDPAGVRRFLAAVQEAK